MQSQNQNRPGFDGGSSHAETSFKGLGKWNTPM